MSKKKIINFEEAEKRAKARDNKIDSIYDQLQAGGYSDEEKAYGSGEICANYNGQYGVLKPYWIFHQCRASIFIANFFLSRI